MRAAVMKLMLLDGHSIANRAFHALPLLTTRSGQPTNAIYGFLQTLLKLLDDEKPDLLVVAMDRPERTFRHGLYEGYKGHRPEGDPNLISQFPLLDQVLSGLGIAVVSAAGYEADDVIGTLARQAADEGHDALIVSGDRDLLQLVGRQCQVLLVRGVERMVRYGADDVERDFGVRPDQIPDLKGLAGDSSDAIPGVRGIGPKTAVKLLAGGRHLEDVLSMATETDRSVRLILEQGEIARLSRHLATIDCAAPVHFDLEDMRFHGVFPPQAADILLEMEFRGLVERLTARGRLAAAAPAVVPEAALDWETTDLCALDTAWPLGYVLMPTGVAVSDGRRAALLDGATADAWLQSDQPKVGHDVKRSLHRLWSQAREVQGTGDDVALMAYLLSPSQESYPVADLSARYLQGQMGDGEAAQAVAIARLRGALREEIQSQGLLDLYAGVEMPLLYVLADMERQGVTVNGDGLRTMGKFLAETITSVEERIYAMAGEIFTIGSTPQLRRILFERLGLPVLKRTKTGPSTDAEVLEQLATQHDIVGAILEWRQLVKLKSTYIDGLLPLIGADGKIHTTFNQMVASTGRLSSTEPNLQNIPVRMEMGRLIRRVFVPSREGRTLLAADYSQIELRVLAHVSGDPTLCEAFRSGEDIHSRTAAEVFGIAAADVTGEMRRAAKAVNFGIVYGISDFGLARDLGVSRMEASEFIRRYFERYPKIKAYLDESVSTARERGYTTTILGRRRYLPDLAASNRMVRAMAERTAMNSPIQGSAADIIKIAMVNIARRLEGQALQAAMLLQVHDELIFEVESGNALELGKLVRQEMEGAVRLDVPIEVEVKVGPSWYDVEQVDLDA